MKLDKRLLVFFPLAFLLSWYPWLLFKAHFKYASGGINPLGPMVAALICAAIFSGRAGIKELLGRYLRWRIGWLGYAFPLLAPVALVVVSAMINILLSAARPATAKFSSWSEMLTAFLFAFVFVGLGEETGWRGYALPCLLERFSSISSGLILGVIWAAWHIPLMGIEFPWHIVPAFLISVLAGSTVQVWLFRRTQGSLLPQPLMHAVVNTVGAGFVFRMFSGADLTRLWWIYTGAWLLLALGLAAASPLMRSHREMAARA